MPTDATFLRRSPSSPTLAGTGALNGSDSSAFQLAQCVHEVSEDDNFRFAPGRHVEALKPQYPAMVCILAFNHA